MGGGGTVSLVGQSTYCGDVAITVVFSSVVSSLHPHWPVIAYPSQLSFVLVRSRLSVLIRSRPRPLSLSSTLMHSCPSRHCRRQICSRSFLLIWLCLSSFPLARADSTSFTFSRAHSGPSALGPAHFQLHSSALDPA